MFEQLMIKAEDVVMLGDSITDGCEWNELIPGKRLKNRGISGDTYAGVLNRLDVIVKGKPQKIFLMIGINDLSQGKGAKQITEGNRAIVRQIKEKSPETKVYVQSLLPVNPCYCRFKSATGKWAQVAGVNAQLRQMATEEKVEYIDLFPHFAVGAKLNPKLSNDGLHLLGEGYAIWKELLLQYLQEKQSEATL